MSSIASSGGSRRGGLRIALRRLALLVLALLALPYLVTPLYLFGRPVSTVMLWRWMTGARVERIYVPLEAVARPLPLSVIVAEDGRFCSHWGIDWAGLQEAIEEADDLSEARGGSTLVQQLAKNLFLWPGRSYLRKALEFPLAIWIDLVLPKRRIMEIYLNVAEWGPNGEFGVEAGARHAFGKSARTLGWRESALLAATLPNPERRRAGRPGPGLRRLAGIYEARARRGGGLDDCLYRAKP
ncbi:MAG TPA: transglycosylase domain-containing protein [Xanthobacteraceae bacterium]|nr:transglycosylase domain-containing protein [Xanthobacteraceae bacterium]